jgi:PAS domain S-box-containing protein
MLEYVCVLRGIAMSSSDRSDLHTMQASRYEQLVQAVVDYAIYMLDPDGYVVSWNAGAQRIKGWSADEIIGQHFSLFFTEEDLAEGRPALLLECALRTGVAQDEGWRVRKDGTCFWALAALDGHCARLCLRQGAALLCHGGAHPGVIAICCFP